MGKLAIPMAALLAATPLFAQDSAPVKLRLDEDKQLGAVTIACTGIGQSKHDPRWKAFPLRVEFANDQREILIGAVVTISDAAGTQLVSAECGGAWVMAKLDAGTYTVTVRITDTDAPPQTRTVKVPADGQARETFVFPGL